jgi:peptidyl-prolyl cis-trans isomerase SurA
MTALKNLIVSSLLLFTLQTINAQTLFSYGSKKVTQSEFLKAFNKNNTEIKPGTKAYRDYLDLYIRFKLKVQAALDMKLDTLPTQQAELKSFRSQVANSYMNDEASTNLLVDEAISRSLKDVHVSHIYVQVASDATPATIKKAQDKINLAYSRLLKGEDFEKVATSVSEDPAVTENKGDLGYITVFTLPYDLENLAYTTPIGKFSKVHRSKIGFHIFKNTGERKSPGRIRIAQILISFPPDATLAQKQQAGLKADSLYRALQNGTDFKKLALQFSNDNLSYQNGGELQEFGTGRYDPAFESAAFSLKNDGEFTKPFATTYGYHIIKRIQLTTVTSDKKNKATRDNFYQQVSQNERIDVSKKILLKKVLQQTGYRKFPVDGKKLSMLSDTVLASGKRPPYLKPSTPLFGFTKQTITVLDWMNYLDAIRFVPNLRNGKTNEEILTQFVETTALEYYRDHLEAYNKEFAYQLKEFKEGNLLFEIMQRKIWDKASADTIGLKKYYNEHKDKYWWEASADALILTSNNDSISEATKKKLQATPNDWRRIVEASDGAIQGDSGRFELGQLPVVDRTAFSNGLITATFKSESDNSATFCYIIKLYNDRQPRSFADARGFVINDYQAWLEEKWIVELKKKYPVVVNEAIFKGLPK